MVRRKLNITSPADLSYLNLILNAYKKTEPTSMRVAVAYATHSGIGELTTALDKLPSWGKVQKKWLVGIDFCRSDPQALAYLDGLLKSDVRVFDGEFVVSRRGCVPRTSYHPKLYAMKGKKHEAVVLGSGNLSYTGLRIGVEAGVSISGTHLAETKKVSSWFNRYWGEASPLDCISDMYEQQYRARENRKNPVPSDDDTAPESTGSRGQLTPQQLRKLRVCRFLWIQAGNLHKNRGIDKRGNQLMLKRNTRVFFGFPARDLNTDTTVGDIAIEYGGNIRSDCSIRFSNNSMDVLTLPIPDSEGPPMYDQKTLCFEQTGVRQFRLVIGKTRDLTKWKRQSEAVDGYFKMSSSREWGVF